MLDFEEEVARFQPSLEVGDVETQIVKEDLTDMTDLMVELPKQLDHHNCRNLKYETDLLLAENYISKVVFDFSRTEFMDSSGIGILLNRYKQMAGSGGTVTIYGVNAQVGRVLAIGGIGRLMKYFDTKEAAIAG